MNPIFIARKSVFPLSLEVERRWPAIHTSPDVKSSIPGEASEGERGREPGARPKSECREGDEESDEDGRLRGFREPADRSRGENDALGREPAEDAPQRDEEENPEGRERQRGRLQLDAREDRRRGESPADQAEAVRAVDRKSTRLNSSHDQISYAVFCLKKKNYIRRASDPSSTAELRYPVPL